ncbi:MULTISPECIES: DedA family protein [unclassified Rathayibacter]|uniref:DedA family protein n=1 Tax=unclassified Rathayibacter TaxID=2609250 RepID=UPI001FB1F93A|nr:MULTISPECIES: VTT domain-containing protein [unclassified Rathayibacter]MCJ1674957.1 VTT domain-containing protein [Rathayibacter sp. VKM Ac-2929]MCJ1681741.1 VTT domain-containing protein [Rathayibacter sp. VKM Ac-2928]MCJ1686326.1 VTT domain-containing protein [Rathayibacter sp. VKM Ac-2927]
MPAFLDELGFAELLAALFVIVLVRAQATYWVARAVVTGAASRRWGRWLESPALKRASALLARYGAPAVTVSFLTVGLQTMINAAAGAARMRFGVYLLAMLPGCAAWALIYATVGFAVLWAVIGAAAGSPLGVAVLVALAAAVVTAVLLLRRRGIAR